MVFGAPVISSISEIFIFLSFEKEMTFCNVPRASRNAPSASKAINWAPPSSILYPSFLAIFFICSDKIASFGFLKMKLWQRETIVSGTFSISVVAKIKITCSGGSSIVLSSAFQASLVNI